MLSFALSLCASWDADDGVTASVTKQPCLATGEAISRFRKAAPANGNAALRPINES